MRWTELDRESPQGVGVTRCDYLRPRVHGSGKGQLGYWECLNERLEKECGGVGENLQCAGLLLFSELGEDPSGPASSGESQKEEDQD